MLTSIPVSNMAGHWLRFGTMAASAVFMDRGKEHCWIDFETSAMEVFTFRYNFRTFLINLRSNHVNRVNICKPERSADMHKLSLWIRIPVTALAVSVIAALVVSLFGWLRNWSTTQFSNGMFYTGVIALLIAIIFSFNRKSTLPDYYKPPSPSERNESQIESITRWTHDMRRGYNAFLLMTLVGVLLIGLSVWIASYVI